MSVDQRTSPEVPEASEPTSYRMCRVGSLFWRVPKSQSQFPTSEARPAALQQMIDKLSVALERDSRVVGVLKPEIKPDYSGLEDFYPDMQRTSGQYLLTGADQFQAMSLSSPIRFHVHVPMKNQPRLHGWDDIPTEDYFVAWDGITAFVLWEQADDHMPISGGHVITNVLDAALATIGAELYIQACRPECDNVFFHTALHVYSAHDDMPSWDDLIEPRDDRNGVNIFAPEERDNFEVLSWLYVYLGLDASRFAQVKNMGRRIMDIESSLRDQTAHLLGHYYEHAVISARPWWRSIKDRWRTKGWRREARQLLAGLWLSLANIESLRRDWADSRRDFEEGGRESMALFERDYSDDVATIESLDTSHVDSSIEQIGRSFDNRAVVMATAGGALAGGLAGVLIGLIH